MTVLGIDCSTKAVDLVYLDDDTDTATWQRITLPPRPRPRKDDPKVNAADESTKAARAIRAHFPRRRHLEDHGVRLVAIEDPYGQALGTVKRLAEITGAVKALVPPELPIVTLTPNRWRTTNDLPARGDKADVVTPHARRLLELVQAVDGWAPDAFDAYLIARAARTLNP